MTTDAIHSTLISWVIVACCAAVAYVGLLLDSKQKKIGKVVIVFPIILGLLAIAVNVFLFYR